MPSAHPLYSIDQHREIERNALAGLPSGTLMRRAGKAAADCAALLLPTTPRAHLLVLAGPGNNGGDACEAAFHLAASGWEVHLLFAGKPSDLPADARDARQRAQASGTIFHQLEDWAGLLHAHPWQLVIDGLFGIGLTRPITEFASLIAAVNALSCQVLSLDVPSGLNADTGCRLGGGIAVRATCTITFLGDKPGLHTGEGRDHAGRVIVDSLQLANSSFPPAVAELASPALFARHLQPRMQASHKGTYGNAIILGGAAGMSGAVLLAGRSAAFCGAGRVYTGFIDTPPTFDPIHPELMCRSANNIDLHSGALVVGPGLGLSEEAHRLVANALQTSSPLVLDADALNAVAGSVALQDLLSQRDRTAILTPHPLEAARLLGISAAEVQNDRLQCAQRIAQRFRVVTVLKGSGTVIVAAGRTTSINPTGNPALATAGSGDVLAGVCGALLAQGWDEHAAAVAAVWLHGEAADRLVEAGIGPAGCTASELIPALRTALNTLISQHARTLHAAP